MSQSICIQHAPQMEITINLIFFVMYFHFFTCSLWAEPEKKNSLFWSCNHDSETVATASFSRWNDTRTTRNVRIKIEYLPTYTQPTRGWVELDIFVHFANRKSLIFKIYRRKSSDYTTQSLSISPSHFISQIICVAIVPSDLFFPKESLVAFMPNFKYSE